MTPARGGRVAVFGGGPAGLAAAERLSALGHVVTVYEQMPTVARKFLLAGKSGLNLTHAEDFAAFAGRYGEARERLLPALENFGPSALRDWADSLGAETFVGSSGRVFPKAMKASPLLRAWLRRLEGQGVRILTRHRWAGFDGGGHRVETPDGPVRVECDAALFAFGGASWPRLGANAAWIADFRAQNVEIDAFSPSNCGFDMALTGRFYDRYAGEPVKSVSLTSAAGTTQGEFVITRTGVEGGLIYAHSAALRDALKHDGEAFLTLDLAPGRSEERLARDLSRQDSKASFSTLLRKGVGLSPVKAALVGELFRERDPNGLAQAIKALKIPVLRPRPIEEAISSAGGIAWSGIDPHFMLKTLPGVFVAGEMVDWDAPTGGYLLTACFAMGRAAADGADHWLRRRN